MQVSKNMKYMQISKNDFKGVLGLSQQITRVSQILYTAARGWKAQQLAPVKMLNVFVSSVLSCQNIQISD